ncbi:hypothetical protein FNYG_12462 [Fusarium nygamai]|uniref:F-box domain-containing protein n=1 Tax=Gibberella nygamai TaxID=42673 RepID=A0A2K0VWL4_GIBNY|nr:hypothetical protein FNYG_12462 [Fusarium nygamai]
MPTQQDTTPRVLDRFGSLPLEINVFIMESLTLHDLLSLTRASPGAWRHFHIDYAFIIRSHIAWFYDHYADPAAIPLLALLARLRLLRSKVKGKPRDVVEQQLRPVFDSILSALHGDTVKMGVKSPCTDNGGGYDSKIERVIL